MSAPALPTAPTPADRARWLAADQEARPARLARLRERLAADGLDAYFGVRPENARYLTGIALGDGEEKVAGQSGWFLIDRDGSVVLADSRYRLKAEEECPDSRIEPVYHDLAERWHELVASLTPVAGGGGVRRLAVEAASVPYAIWSRLAAAAPDVELVPLEGAVESQRAVKEPAEVERIAAACAVADGALDVLLADIRPGRTESELALDLEWRIRTKADGLAFVIACLAGPRAALPHGSPGARKVVAGQVLLFDFGARVAGYRSDMTRTLFVGEPSARDLEVYRLVAAAQAAALVALTAAAARGERPTNRSIDSIARDLIVAAGYGERFGHGLGHGIGLATHELPSLSFRAAEGPLPAPTVFSVEPGIYLDGETGVRIEDLVLFDPDAGRLERLTRFPRGVTVVGA